jgi:hypothetical protein
MSRSSTAHMDRIHVHLKMCNAFASFRISVISDAVWTHDNRSERELFVIAALPCIHLAS